MTNNKYIRWLCVLLILIKYQASAQTIICDSFISYHPIDKRISFYRDSLKLNGIDTILIYRHWKYTNGFNGYGKVIWIENNECFQRKIEYTNNGEMSYLVEKEFTTNKTDSILKFFFGNKVDTINENPTKQAFGIDHDANHFVDVTYGKKKYCFIISGLLVHYNPDNLRAKMIVLLADENITSVVFYDNSNPENRKRWNKKKPKK